MKEQIEFQPIKRSKQSPRNWKNYLTSQVLKGVEGKEERLGKRKEWQDEFNLLRSDIMNRFYDIKHGTYGDSKKEFMDDKFFLKKSWGEFLELITEDVEDLVNVNEKEIVEKKDESNIKGKKFDSAVRSWEKKKQEAKDRIERLVPEFFSYDREKQLDILDGMYRDMEESTYF